MLFREGIVTGKKRSKTATSRFVTASSRFVTAPPILTNTLPNHKTGKTDFKKHITPDRAEWHDF